MEQAGTPPHFLRLTLEGTESNRDGLSSRIQAYVNGNVQERRVRSASSYLSQSELTATFGLGTMQDVDSALADGAVADSDVVDRVVVDSVVVEWPSGRIDRFKDVPGNVEYRIVEGRGRLEIVPTPTHTGSPSSH